MSKVAMPEPVAKVMDGYSIFWAGSGPIFPLVDRNKVKVGSLLITTTQAEAYAAAKVREAQRWQPIETAPKDGTPVLLFARLESAEASTRVVGSFILGEWLAQSYVGQNKAVLVPSHWMPLPPFPPLPGPVEPRKNNE